MKTIKKTLDILEVFLKSKSELSISEIGKITGYHPATIHDILQELARRGYVRQREKRGKYSLGLSFLSFTSAINKALAIEDIVHPFMIELSKQVNEAINIAVHNGNDAVNIAVVQPNQRLRVVIDEMTGIPLYCTAVGKIFLASMTDEEVDKYLNTENLIQYTPNTITDKKKLMRQIKKISRECISMEHGEYSTEIRNVAAPLMDYHGKTIAAFGVIGPPSRMTRAKMKEMKPLIKKYALRISKALGYKAKTGESG